MVHEKSGRRQSRRVRLKVQKNKEGCGQSPLVGRVVWQSQPHAGQAFGESPISALR
jgi:hypothetical protein